MLEIVSNNDDKCTYFYFSLLLMNGGKMMDNQKMVLDVHERPSLLKWLPLSLQHLFAMFGATILVPYLVGIDPAVALVTSGVGTLAFLLITGGKVPAYLGSSFAFIAPLTIVVQDPALGVGAAMLGAMFAGILYGIVSLLIVGFGTNWLRYILPPVVVGPVIMVIGLGLAGVAVNMAMTDVGTGEYEGSLFFIALVSLAVTIVAAVVLRGFFGLIPVLLGIVVGYITAFVMGVINFEPLQSAWSRAMERGADIGFVPLGLFEMPNFVAPDFSMAAFAAVLIIMPIALVTLSEHLGDMLVISKVMNRDLTKRPGLHRTLLGDGVATAIAAMLGGPPNTTYGENVGVLAITRIFSIFVVAGAAVLAIIFGFIGVVNALIQTIPVNVMGGVSILLFGIIASSGLRVLIESNVQLSEKRNLIIASVILVIGIGGAFIPIGEEAQIPGMALATIVGILLHLILPNKKVAYGNKPMFNENVTAEVTENGENNK